MTVEIQCLTDAGPTRTAVSSAVMSREDTVSGTTPIPIPSNPGTNFSYVKTFQVNITATGGLTMTNILIGAVAASSLQGFKVWHVTSHAVGSYVQAVTPPGATGDNNVTAPTINGATATALPLVTSAPPPYSTGPYAAVAAVGNLVEVALGVDGTAVATGPANSVQTARWQWSEA